MKLRLLALVASFLFSFAVQAAEEVPWAQGTIKNIDPATHTATIAHGPIDSIGMGAMTMQFAVRDAAGLAKLKAGDKIRFQAVMAGSDIVVTRIEARK
jgi:Cu(I)/Ag(I) efflux system periplasmic protein CusF